MRKSVLYLSGLLLIVSCASAPIQEMSDARQAINAAHEVVDAAAPNGSRERIERASALMEAAEAELRNGEFSKARDLATAAKQLAIEAREGVDGDQAK